jgi:hypothetical protein
MGIGKITRIEEDRRDKAPVQRDNISFRHPTLNGRENYPCGFVKALQARPQVTSAFAELPLA